MAKSSVSMKLLIDTKAKRVLFAEAGKDSVDFLFYILSLPVANIINLMGKQGMVGSLGNLYDSIENLNESYMQPNQTKDTLLKPAYPFSSLSVPLLSTNDNAPMDMKIYTCKECYCFAKFPTAICPDCHSKMTVLMKYVAPPVVKSVSSGLEGGGVVMYMVMDDLVVMPMSTLSSIALLNKFHLKEVGSLEEKVVDFGMDEVVKLLKASLETTNVLTHVFLGG
ncbi:hypothetical protein STAS_20494 [Striga asiatica]|uniref:DUF674 domain-containing protein n=1 Tax=Striga asiatica TaxID=4170 RepID=A0A5A7QEH1_STRAF|nr:hypothetical protein STAS_20494 [Striga asiatica]